MNYRSKIDFEGKFHKLCNGGAITYVELKEMPGKNIEAVEEIIEYAYSRAVITWELIFRWIIA